MQVMVLQMAHANNARMILKGFAAEIVHADGADTALGDSGAAETLQSRAIVHNDAGSSESLAHAAQATHEETVATSPWNKLKVLPAASESFSNWS
ncbi:unnamed protein product [Sphagnum troendelagicum]|uniref:Uncharacterized protein n=1 Tax=Sphagnum troendelagicum TaxID=128251 RepID=A0ABP0TH02_9BRYO